MTTFVRRTIAIAVGLALPLAVALPAGAASTESSTQRVELQWEQAQQRLQQTERHLQQVKRSLTSADSETPSRHVEVLDPTVYAQLDTAIDNAQSAGFEVGNIPSHMTAEQLLREKGAVSTVDMLIDVVHPLATSEVPEQDLPELPSLGLLDGILQLIFGLLSSLGLPLPLPLPLPVSGSDLPLPSGTSTSTLTIPLQAHTS